MAENRIQDEGQDPSWVTNLKRHDEESPQKVYAVVAEYDTPGELLEASRRVRDAGYSKWDTLTPFPVHGIDEAMGIKPTILPWIVLCMGLAGGTLGLGLQYFTNTVFYPYLISGKPMFSLPANIPVTYELTILFAAFTAFFSVLGLSMLPEFFHPLFRLKRMERYTNDRFAVVIQGNDPIFERERASALLKETGGNDIETIFAPEKTAPIPAPVVGVSVIIGAILLLPPAFVARARFSKSEKPRIHIIQDMDMQQKFKAQFPSELLQELYGDPRASLQPVPGTLARQDFVEDDVWLDGKLPSGDYSAAFPEGFVIDEGMLERGQQRYAISCMPCHGLAGDGQGLVANRALFLADAIASGRANTGMAWAPPANLADARIQVQPIGEIFHTISYGLNNMMGYATQVNREDRWAIAAYVRVLQKSQGATLADVPAEVRAEVEQELVEARAAAEIVAAAAAAEQAARDAAEAEAAAAEQAAPETESND